METLDERLVGTWVTEHEDSSALFSIDIKESIFVVTGFDQSDGEQFEVENIMWNGTTLSFSATMPSTGFRSKNAFRMLPDGTAELELTVYEVWKKKT